MSPVSTVHFLLPDGVDDPRRPSGGNVYDRRVCDGLGAAGWRVLERRVPGAWPSPDASAPKALARLLRDIPDGSAVIIDGLIASAVPGVLVPEADRLRLVVLLHLPLGDGPAAAQLADGQARERAVLGAVAGIVATSSWTRDWLLHHYPLARDKIRVAEPGVDLAALAPGTAAGGDFLCVAAVIPGKGQDVVLAALATLRDLPWRCVCVGSVDRDPAFVARLRRQAAAAGLVDRVCFVGPRTGDQLDRAYAAADLLVLASQAETYGMVVTEALARGLPVVATAVGGLPGTLGHTADGRRPGLLVPPGDHAALAGVLRRWLEEPELRGHLRSAAQARRTALSGWRVTTEQVAGALARAAA